MTGQQAVPKIETSAGLPGADAILNALDAAVVVIGPDDAILFLNAAGEQFFAGSAAYLCGRDLSELLPLDSPLFNLIGQVRDGGVGIAEYGLTLESPRIARREANIQATPIADRPGCVVVSLFERSIAEKIDRQLVHRGAARTVTALAAMLAHEVKNPLSGIRGAAQLLEHDSSAEERKLTRLICDETDRICALVDRMEVFSASGPIRREAVNIHEVLEHVRRLAESGFAQGLRIVESYDPSLPPVDGNRDQLIQIFLNLVKNAAEAAPAKNGEIVLSTAYRKGVTLTVPGSDARTQLPLTVRVQDNGEGIPDEMRDHLFDAFVTSKPKGSGLGLALVAKMVGDHGGIVEFESQPGRTVFQVMLPVAAENGGGAT